MRLGAFDYISKPDLNRLLNTVRNVGPQGLVFRKHTPQEKVSKIMRNGGEETSWSSLLNIIEKSGSHRGSVLITGDNGTGKSWWLHEEQSFSGPFIEWMCCHSGD
jgi:DNA-binding NtrC family response regulator